MMIIAMSTYKKPMEEVNALRPAHKAHFQAAIEKGDLLVSGRQSSGKGGVIISKSLTQDEFQRLIDSDPYVTEGAAEYQLVEFDPNIWHNVLDPILAE